MNARRGMSCEVSTVVVARYTRTHLVCCRSRPISLASHITLHAPVFHTVNDNVYGKTLLSHWLDQAMPALVRRESDDADQLQRGADLRYSCSKQVPVLPSPPRTSPPLLVSCSPPSHAPLLPPLSSLPHSRERQAGPRVHSVTDISCVILYDSLYTTDPY